MSLEIIDQTENPDGEHYADITYDGDGIVNVDAHNGQPPTVKVIDPSHPEDALAVFKFNEDGELESHDIR